MSRFSHRLAFQASVNRITQHVEQRKADGKPLIDLTETNPTRALSNYPHQKIAETLGALTDVSYLPDPRGTAKARRAIAEHYAVRNVALNPSRMFLTASTSEAYTYLFKILCNPGDAVLSPIPSYPLFEHLAALSSVEMRPYRILYDGAWHIDFENLRSQIDSRARAIVVVNPNNPTGHFAGSRDSERLLDIAAEFDLAIISDEVFLDYPITDSKVEHRSLAGRGEAPVFILNGLSKKAGMPQMKLAWTVVDGSPHYCKESLSRIELIADAYLSVATPVQDALPGLLRVGDGIRVAIQEQVRNNWRELRRTLLDTNAHGYQLEAGWTAIVRLPSIRTEEEWVLKLIDDYGVIVQPGYFFDMTHGVHAVVSLLTSPAEFSTGMHGLKDALIQG